MRTFGKEQAMPHGYNRKILHVNLSSAALEIEQPPEEFYRKYMGATPVSAVSFAANLLLKSKRALTL